MNKQHKERPILSNSSANTFTECQERYHLNVVEGLIPKVSAKPLAFGDLIHKVMELYWRAVKDNAGGGVDSVITGARLAIEQWITERKEAFLSLAQATGDYDRAIDAVLDPDSPDAIQPQVDLALDILTRHAAKYFAADCRDWEVLEIEWAFRLPLREANGRRSAFDYAGRVDLVLRSRRNGRLYVADHKTTAKGPDSFGRDLALDPQPRGYAWAVSQSLNERVHGFIYNVMRKKSPGAPQVLKVKNQGRALSVAKGTDTTPEIFEAAIREHDPGNEAAYSAVLEALRARGDTFLWRHEHVVTERQMDQWRAARCDVARQLKARKRAGRWLKNFRACRPFAGAPCPYYRVCLDPDAGPERLAEFDVVKTGGAPELAESDNPKDDWDLSF